MAFSSSSQDARPPRGSTFGPFAVVVGRIQGADALDRPAEILRRLTDATLSSHRVRSVLRGKPIGHALHPLLTDFPLGAWTSTSLLDLFDGRRARPAATGLLSFGVVTALPTVLSGLAEWRKTTGPARRVGVAGGFVATVGGYLGGHLSLVLKVGTADPALAKPFPGTSGLGTA
ncbi:MAG: hypothetical protein M3302_06310 [Actinomycetota bacterium]|nr:hypothetical protein [Actinomycetota bacterium]